MNGNFRLPTLSTVGRPYVTALLIAWGFSSLNLFAVFQVYPLLAYSRKIDFDPISIAGFLQHCLEYFIFGLAAALVGLVIGPLVLLVTAIADLGNILVMFFAFDSVVTEARFVRACCRGRSLGGEVWVLIPFLPAASVATYLWIQFIRRHAVAAGSVAICAVVGTLTWYGITVGAEQTLHQRICPLIEYRCGG